MTSTRFRRVLIRATLILVSSILGMLLVEFGTRWIIVPDRLDVPPERAFRVNSNTANTLLLAYIGTDCSWLESFQPSFYFSYVYNSAGDCGVDHADANGFMNRATFPWKRSPDAFSILVLGGSVAEALARTEDKNLSFLEEKFREKYLGPKGERIDVYSGAIGGWLVPNQELVLMQFMQGFDAVIAFDGANELSRLDLPGWVGRPNPQSFSFFFDHSVLFAVEFKMVKIFRKFRHFWPLRSSYAWAGLQSLIESAAQDELFSKIGEKDNIGRFADLPVEPNVTNQQIVEKNIQRYIQSIKNVLAMSKANGLLAMHMIQPIAKFGKPLTAAEQAVSEHEGSRHYRRLEQETLAALKGQESSSLSDIFQHETGPIYADRVHPIVHNGESRGYSMMAEAIRDRAAKVWHLTPISARERPSKSLPRSRQ